MINNIERILNFFNDINKIPRQSKNEKEISNWLFSWAEENGFQVEKDSSMNLLIKVPASKGYEDKDVVILQGHMDMVCEKIEGSNHDFTKDPIDMSIVDGWLKAKETSLGADNGIALAISMALATDPEVKHPGLELLFTVDEEMGMTGATNIASGWLTGKTLINIDSEDEGVFTIGCAGGQDSEINYNLDLITDDTLNSFLALKVEGLKGGHSGVDINLERANANIIMARLLGELTRRGINNGIANLSGGSARNAISRSCSASISVKSADLVKAKNILSDFIKVIQEEYKSVDPNICLVITEDQEASKYYNSRCMDLVLALPHGVFYNAMEMDDIVETSSNLARLSIKDNQLNIVMSQRSSTLSRLDEMCNKIEAVAHISGASVVFGDRYSPWQPDFNSNILSKFKKSYLEVFNREPKIEVIHAGLECGVLGTKYPEIEMISIGPTIENPHSPGERLLVSTIKDIWDLMVYYLG